MKPGWTAAALIVILPACLVAARPHPAAQAQPSHLDQLNARVKELFQEGKFAEAQPLAARAAQLAQAAKPPGLASINITASNLGRIDDALGRYAEAEPLLKRALAIDEKELGPDDADIASDLDLLGTLYEHMHRYANAEALFERALAIDARAKDVNPGDLSRLDSDAGILFADEGKFERAEELDRQALALDEKAKGDDDPDVAADLNNFATLFDAEGKFAEAEKLYKLAMAVDEKALAPDDPSVATDLQNLADHYRLLGDTAQAIPMAQRALAIREKAFGPESAGVAGTLNLLALLLKVDKRPAEAVPLLERSLAIREKVFGPDSAGLAAALNNLAQLDEDLGRLDQAEPLYLRSIALLEREGAPGDPDLEAAVMNLAVLLAKEGKAADAEPLFERGFKSMATRFDANFAFMTEKDRLSSLDLSSYYFERYYSFVHSSHLQIPALTGQMYNLLLWQKGLVAAGVAQMRRAVEASGDAEALRLVGELSAARSQLAATLSAQPGNETVAQQCEAEALRRRTDQLERQLVVRAGGFARPQAASRPTWQQVRDALAPGEAAVEFVRFRFYGKDAGRVFYYAALVVTHDTSTQPAYIYLGDDKQIEADAVSHFKRALATRGFAQTADAALPGPHAYDLLWKPLEPALAGITRVYVATDGALNQIPLGIIPVPDGKLLLEKYDLRLVSSTRDLLAPNAPAAAANTGTALLVGDPDFNLSDTGQRAALLHMNLAVNSPKDDAASTQACMAERSGASNDHQSDGPAKDSAASGTMLPSLPGTTTEVSSIASLLHSRGWQAQVYTGDAAIKQVVESAARPRLIHLATHGFFLPDPAASGELTGDVRALYLPDQYSALNEPMLRSGLYFAGADRTLAGRVSPPGLDNGVLTALEAANLNLSGTELVVLSACQTGQGEEKNGEGVFGLRRALEEAGARHVLMSLWSVPDQETEELMKAFYSRWLAGVEIHAALMQAQLEMREKVKAAHDGKDLPYYWGAFVLVGR